VRYTGVMHGVLLIDKPAGWTSFDVVNYVRKIVSSSEGVRPKQIKVGHTGTLDPFATGLLVLLIGKDYTKRAVELSKLDKTYEVTIYLGKTSSTGDTEGEITECLDEVPSLEAIEDVLKRFQGEILQVPPAHSAIKVNGQRAYKLARAGQEVILKERKVTINSLGLDSYNYPKAKLLAAVSSGTYIRTLVQDVGEQLGVGAYTSDLRRTSVGGYLIADACEVEGLDAAIIQQRLITLE
jgi:tRNA pseudouridine55 synthase